MRGGVARRPRVIVGLPDRAEGALVADWLSENQFEAVRRSTPDVAAKEMEARAFDLLITDVRWVVGTGTSLRTGRSRSPQAPAILIGDVTDHRGMAVNAQTTYLTRPIDLAVLSCFVSMALMDDRPVRRSPRKTVQRFDAFVNDVPAGVVDVSAEGLRLEVYGVPPPYFAVRIPLVGVAVIAKRMWTMSPSQPGSTMWCGGALSNNRPVSEEAWRSFVDTVPVIATAGPSRPRVPAAS
jgi:hypothetical protein